MIENPSQTLKEISDEKEISNSTVEENTSETPKKEDLIHQFLIGLIIKLINWLKK